ncbi:MAG: azurin [Alysiella sp.]|uniref:azurin n=1 Tax=Alysiella sp. TaxID=1872483 RepID=UPI0026DC2BFC|nr:azurin [Alysiella sp.]MDO4433708.1 azurin [Alysiella sp.]
MKLYLGLITAAALTLAACGGESKPAQTAVPSAPAPAAEASMPASEPVIASEPMPVVASQDQVASEPVAATAGDCAVVVNSNDNMQFDTKEIAIKSSCAQFTITLKHTGKAPVAAMGHNLVIAKTADKTAVINDGMTAKAENGYLKVNDERVVAHTKMLGGGEEDSITFDTAKLKDGDFEFFCTFPGHAAMMSGKIKLVD